MDEEYQIVYVEKPQESAWGIIGQGLGEYNDKQAGDDNSQFICYVVQGPDQEILGGVIGAVHYEWFYLDLMWVKEELRGRGYGHKLLTAVEDAARKGGATKAYLDTFSFQAPDFYKKQGYRIFGELKDFPKGHQRYYCRKELK